MSSKLVHAILIACKAFLPAYIEDKILPLVCELSIVGDPAAAASEVRDGNSPWKWKGKWRRDVIQNNETIFSLI